MTLAACGLSVRFDGRTVLGPVDLTLTPGLTALVGRNGAGKTTCLRALTGLLISATGQVTWRGRPLNSPEHLRDFRTRLGYMPQDFSAYPQLTVAGFISHVAAMKGLGRNAKAAAATALEQLGLTHLAAVRPAALSGGQLRFVALAQAIVADPDVLILDEPLRGLDADSRQQMAGWLQDWAKGRIIVLSAHGPDLDHVAARWVLLDAGQIRSDAAGSELIHASHGRVWDVLAAGSDDAVQTLQQVTRAGQNGAIVRLVSASPLGPEWRLRVVLPPGAGEGLLRTCLDEHVTVRVAGPLPAGAEAAYLALLADVGV